VLIDLYQQRMRALRAEVDGWREVHAKIWAPFGPRRGAATLGSGIGGGTASSPLDGPSDRENVKDELVRLWGSVRQEGENLRLSRALPQPGRKAPGITPIPLAAQGPDQLVTSAPGSPPGRRTRSFIAAWTSAPSIGTAVRAPAPGIVVFRRSSSRVRDRIDPRARQMIRSRSMGISRGST
jgi:hypothetical protein